MYHPPRNRVWVGTRLRNDADSARPFRDALQYFVYNFIRIHRTLRVTPAMAAGVTNRLWEVSDLVALLEAAESKGKAA